MAVNQTLSVAFALVTVANELMETGMCILLARYIIHITIPFV